MTAPAKPISGEAGRRAESHPHGQPFGNIVQGNGQHQQRAARQTGGPAVRKALQGMQMRQQDIQKTQRNRAAQKTEGHRHKTPCAPSGPGQFQRGIKQGPERGRQHHSGGEPQHDIQRTPGKFAG